MYEQKKSNNVQAFKILFDIEVILREIIAKSMQSAYGHKWIKRGLPSDLQEKAMKSLKYERLTKWQKLTPHHPLYYLDFPDLKKIISNKRTFPEVFSEVLYNKEVSENSLSEIELIRNKVAHNRFISDSELTVLEGAWSKISGSMGVENIQEARTSASDRVPIVQTLKESLLILLNSKNLVETGAAIDPKSLEPLKRLDVWWFDSEFLAEDVNVVEVYIKKLFEYAEIPRGFGQALTRRNWAQENSIAQIAHAALAKIEEMCRSAENTYA